MGYEDIKLIVYTDSNWPDTTRLFSWEGKGE